MLGVAALLRTAQYIPEYGNRIAVVRGQSASWMDSRTTTLLHDTPAITYRTFGGAEGAQCQRLRGNLDLHARHGAVSGRGRKEGGVDGVLYCLLLFGLGSGGKKWHSMAGGDGRVPCSPDDSQSTASAVSDAHSLFCFLFFLSFCVFLFIRPTAACIMHCISREPAKPCWSG